MLVEDMGSHESIIAEFSRHYWGIVQIMPLFLTFQSNTSFSILAAITEPLQFGGLSKHMQYILNSCSFKLDFCAPRTLLAGRQ